jgi:excisionase family DNA binding protein
MNQFMEVREVAVAGDGPWLTPAEVAKILGVHPNTVRKMADEGLLDDPEPVWWLGSHRKISQKSAERRRDELRKPKT